MDEATRILLTKLYSEFRWINPNMPIPANGGKMLELIALAQRAGRLLGVEDA